MEDLAKWSSALKARKLSLVPDAKARNLLAQMLQKEPLRRPSLARVLMHPFLSGKHVARLDGDPPKYDVFLSYRVASDTRHVEKLYKLLTEQGLTVFWDKSCLEPGEDWEQGFCAGLVSSRAFVPFLSRDAINHPDKEWQNFSKLTADARCDNVFLEHRLAVELQGLRYIEKIFPVFVGNVDPTSGLYSHYFQSGCHPTLPSVSVTSVEEKLRHHMDSQALGTPLEPDRTVASVVNAITASHGAFIESESDLAFKCAAESIVKMLASKDDVANQTGGSRRGSSEGALASVDGATGASSGVTSAPAAAAATAVIPQQRKEDVDTASQASQLAEARAQLDEKERHLAQVLEEIERLREENERLKATVGAAAMPSSLA